MEGGKERGRKEGGEGWKEEQREGKRKERGMEEGGRLTGIAIRAATDSGCTCTSSSFSCDPSFLLGHMMDRTTSRSQEEL